MPAKNVQQTHMIREMKSCLNIYTGVSPHTGKKADDCPDIPGSNSISERELCLLLTD